MDTDRKKQLFMFLSLLIMAGLLLFCLIKIHTLSDRLAVLSESHHELSEEVRELDFQLSYVQNDMYPLSKRESSHLISAEYSIGQVRDDTETAEILLSIVPKSVTEDMRITVALEDQVSELTKNGNTFTGTLDVGLFLEYYDVPFLTIESSAGVKTEYLSDLCTSRLFQKFLPSLHVCSHGGDLINGDTRLWAHFAFTTADINSHAPITFTSVRAIKEVNGEETMNIDVTSRLVPDDSPNTMLYETPGIYPVQGDDGKFYIVAEDSLGFIHKIYVHFWYDSEAELQFDSIHEMIYNSEGNLLYGSEAQGF